MTLPGMMLENLCRQAQSEVVLVAPFIKIAALSRLIQHVSLDANLKCVTRWRLDEIASGVSDIEIWTVIKEHPNSQLWLRLDLHAKFYRGDSTCLIGSANITNTALGWSNQPNLELLVQIPSIFPGIKEFENELISGSIEVDETVFRQVQDSSQKLKEYLPKTPSEDHGASSISKDFLSSATLSPQIWIPSLRHPEHLYSAYISNLQELSAASKETALNDLRALPIPLDLTEEGFNVAVGSLLLQKPIIRKIDTFVLSPQRFGAVKDYLANLPCNQNPDFDPGIAWQTLMRWLLFFLPDRYRMSVPKHSEVFYRVNDDDLS